MRRRVAALALALCLLAGLASGTAPTAQQESAFGQPDAVDPDRVLVRADVPENGDATFTVEYRVALEDENATAAFEQLRTDVEQNTSRYRDRFGERLRRTARTAENATGREMTVENVTVTATERFDGRYGVLRYSATWRGFAAVDGNEVRIGDALAGYYLDENSTLQIETPAGYRVAEVAPTADTRRDGVVSWRGPVAFASDRPVVVASAASEGQLPFPGWLLAAGALVVAGTAAFGLYRRRTAEPTAGDEPAPMTDQSPAAGTGAAVGDDDGSPPRDGPSEPAAGAADDADPMADIDPELLSNEELVEQTLRAHGGRMKQQALIDELDWSETKTSHVVSDMREADRLDSFRVGRENVLILPDVDEGVFER